MADSDIAIDVEGLVKAYDGRTVVDRINFDVKTGEVFALLGPNGAGKTTTVEILEGFRRADEGTVRVLGLDPATDGADLATRIGVMPQEAGFYTQARPKEALELFAAFYKDPIPPSELIETVGLQDAQNTGWRKLSGGEKQRLSLALALIGRPKLVFLDEPTAGMDAHARVATWGLIRALKDDGVTVVLTTHLLDEAERLADRVAIIHRGVLGALGRPSEIASTEQAGRVRFRVPPAAVLDGLADAVGGSLESERPGEYLLTGTDASPAVVAKLTGWLAERGVGLEDLSVGTRSLEEVFLQLTDDKAREEGG